jgi:hypothetical protein
MEYLTPTGPIVLTKFVYGGNYESCVMKKEKEEKMEGREADIFGEGRGANDRR